MAQTGPNWIRLIFPGENAAAKLVTNVAIPFGALFSPKPKLRVQIKSAAFLKTIKGGGSFESTDHKKQTTKNETQNDQISAQQRYLPRPRQKDPPAKAFFGTRQPLGTGTVESDVSCQSCKR